MPKEDYTERVEEIPYDDGCPGFWEGIVEILGAGLQSKYLSPNPGEREVSRDSL